MNPSPMRDPFASPDVVDWDRFPLADLERYLDGRKWTPRNHPRSSVPFTALNDEIVASPPRQLFHVTGGQQNAVLGNLLTANGAFQAFGSSWGLYRADAFPPVAGYRREYRLSHQFLYNTGAVGTTGANWFLKISGTPNALVFIDPGAPYNATRDWSNVSVWITSTELEALTTPTHYFVQWLGNFTGAAYIVALRDFIIEGRYVRL